MKNDNKKSVKFTLSVVRALKISLRTKEKRSFPRYLLLLSILRKIAKRNSDRMLVIFIKS